MSELTDPVKPDLKQRAAEVERLVDKTFDAFDPGIAYFLIEELAAHYHVDPMYLMYLLAGRGAVSLRLQTDINSKGSEEQLRRILREHSVREQELLDDARANNQKAEQALALIKALSVRLHRIIRSLAPSGPDSQTTSV